MPFDYGVNGATRLQVGVTPFLIHRAMTQAIVNAQILDASRIWMVMDDATIPPQAAPDDRFITIRYPSWVWTDGRVMGGDKNSAPLSQLRLTGQTRHTLWLANDRDRYGTAESLADDAFGPSPDGAMLLGPMVKCFWEQDLVNDDGNAITSCPMNLLSLEMATDDTSDMTVIPFRIIWEVKFVWDLSVGG